MAKMTLLEIVQDILSDLDSDEVNSISDTVEALQIAQIVKTTYYELIGSRDWPHLGALFQLTPSGTTSRPTHMSLPENVQRVLWLKYDKATSTDTFEKYGVVLYLNPEDFLNILNSRDSSLSNVETVTDVASNIDMFITNDTSPTYWTSFDDETIMFDSFDNTVDSTLQQSKTQAHGYREPTWTASDTFVPDLPSKAFPLLLAEAKSVAFNAIKQAPNPKEEQRSRRQSQWLARKKWRQNGGIQYPDYGRK